MSDGILAGLGLDEVVDGLAAGVYKGNVFNAKVQDLPGKGKFLIFTYKVNDPDSRYHGESVDEWFSLDPNATNVKKRFLKQRLESLDVPESRFSSFNPNDVIGTDVFFTVKINGQYTNVTKVALAGEGDASVSASTPASGGVNVEDLL